MDSETRLAVIDGNQLIWRVVGAAPLEESSKHAGRFMGWLSTLPRYHKTKKTIVAWDVGESFRKRIFVDYKSKRRKDANLEMMRGAVKDAIKILIPLLEAMGITQAYRKGFEADDVIHSIVIRARKEENPPTVIVYSMDADLLQLVRFPGVFVLHPTGKPLSRRYVESKLGVPPEMVQTLKAIAGDSSDNYKGVHGVGPVNAVKLIKQYGDLFSIYRALDNGDVKPPKLAEKMQAGRDSAMLSWKLAALRLIDFKERKKAANRKKAKKLIFKHKIREALDPFVFESLIEEDE